jgi:hypothetical protein
VKRDEVGAKGDRFREHTEKVAYLTTVNSFLGDLEVKKDWLFPESGDLPSFPATDPIIASSPFPPGWSEVESGTVAEDSLTPPEEMAEEDTGPPVPLQEEDGTVDTVTQDSTNCHDDFIWDVIRDIRGMITVAQWKAEYKSIISNVFRVVRSTVGTTENTQIDRKVAVACRLQCYADAHIKN